MKECPLRLKHALYYLEADGLNVTGYFDKSHIRSFVGSIDKAYDDIEDLNAFIDWIDKNLGEDREHMTVLEFYMRQRRQSFLCFLKQEVEAVVDRRNKEDSTMKEKEFEKVGFETVKQEFYNLYNDFTREHGISGGVIDVFISNFIDNLKRLYAGDLEPLVKFVNGFRPDPNDSLISIVSHMRQEMFIHKVIAKINALKEKIHQENICKKSRIDEIQKMLMSGRKFDAKWHKEDLKTEITGQPCSAIIFDDHLGSPVCWDKAVKTQKKVEGLYKAGDKVVFVKNRIYANDSHEQFVENVSLGILKNFSVNGSGNQYCTLEKMFHIMNVSGLRIPTYLHGEDISNLIEKQLFEKSIAKSPESLGGLIYGLLEISIVDEKHFDKLNSIIAKVTKHE